ncbi:MAG: DUF5941 domain-containing protein [Thermoleophilaceae bacterium]
MSATTVANAAAASRAGGEALERYRDDGALARALGTIGRALPVPPALLVGAGMAGLIVLAATEGDGASNGLVAAGIAWVVLLGGLSSGRPHTDRFAWAVPGFLRVVEYGGLLWIAANAGDSSHAAAFALIAALAFHHYDLVYRPRFQGVAPPVWLGLAAGGWEGRLVLVWALLVAGALPAGMFILAGVLGVVFAIECALSWTRLSVAPLSVYDDEEDEGQ